MKRAERESMTNFIETQKVPFHNEVDNVLDALASDLDKARLEALASSPHGLQKKARPTQLDAGGIPEARKASASAQPAQTLVQRQGLLRDGAPTVVLFHPLPPLLAHAAAQVRISQ